MNAKRPLIIAVAALAAFAPLTQTGVQACDCAPYLEAFERELSLGADIADIGLSVLDPSGRSIALNESLNQSRRARILRDSSIPAECREKFAREKGLLDYASVGTTLSLSLGTGDDSTWMDLSPGTSRMSRLLEVAGKAYRTEPLDPSGCTPQMDREACVGQDSDERLDRFTRGLESMAPGERTSVYRRAARSAQLGRDLSPEEGNALTAFFQLISAKDFSEYRAHSRALAGSLSEREKIMLLAMMGGQMSLGYDRVRAKDNSDGSVVSPERLFSTSKANFSFTGLERVDRAGVCRDMAVAQVMLANDLGLRKAVTISWAAGTGHHTSVAVQAKDGQGHDLYLVNYDNVTVQHGSDGSRLISLRSDPIIRDHSLTYYVHDANGQPLGSITSGKGKLLLEAAGLDARTFDPLARADNDIISGDILLGQRGKGRVSAIAARDEGGDLYLGASGDGTWGTGTVRPSLKDSKGWAHSGKAAIFAGTQIPMTPFRSGDTPDRTDLVMTGVTHTTYTPTLELETLPGLRLQGNAGLDIMAEFHAEYGTVTKTTTKNVPGATITSTWNESRYGTPGWDAEGQFRLGGTGEFELPSSGTLIRVSPTLRIKPDTHDIRATPTVASNWRVYANSLDLAGELQQSLGSGWRAHARGQAVLDRMGSRGLAAAGASSQDFAAEAGASGRLTSEEDVPEMIQDTSKKRGFMNVRYRLAPELDLGGSISTDFLQEHQSSLYLQGTLW
jgi:hypothetical protein